MKMKHKRLKLDCVDNILSKEDVREWFAKYFKIPAYKRYLRFNEIARIMGYNHQYLRNLVSERAGYKIAPEFQVRFTAFVREYGQPREVEKQSPREKREIPGEVYEKFAAAIAMLPTDMAAYYGISKHYYLNIKNGAVPNFRRPTLVRLYEKLTGEEFVW